MTKNCFLLCLSNDKQKILINPMIVVELFFMEIKMKRINLTVITGFCLSLISACATSNPPTVEDISKIKPIFETYKTYSKINDTLKLSSPHGGKYVFTHINDNGIDSYRNKKYPYSDGTIAVKESHGSNDPNSPIDTLFVMKKISGFDKDNGDWYYAMLDSKGNSKDAGKIQMCISCHKTYKEKDYIVGF